MASTTIWKRFSLECAHWLPNVPEDHKCRRMHGHSFQVEVHVTGEPQEVAGWVMDFAEITRVWQPVHEQLDHRCLNEVAGLENPTSERLAAWIWSRLAPTLRGLSEVVVEETCTSGCRYRG